VLRSLGGRWITWKAAQGREARGVFCWFSQENLGIGHEHHERWRIFCLLVVFCFHLKPKDFNHDSWTFFLGFFPVKMVDLDRQTSGVELRNMVICLPRRVQHSSTMMKDMSQNHWDWMIGSSKIVDLTQQKCS